MKTFRQFISEDIVDEGIVDSIRKSNYSRLAKRSSKSADDAFDYGEDDKFSKEMNTAISRKLRAGEKVSQVTDPRKFGIRPKDVPNLHPYHKQQLK
jgi:hypothetical protein